MGEELCGNSDIETENAFEHLTKRIDSALDAMCVPDVRQLVEEIEAEIAPNDPIVA